MSIDNKRVRGWCFTLNNYTAKDWEYCKSTLSNECSYICVGREMGESKTPHLQGYIEYENARRGKAMRKLFEGRAHWEARKGTPKQASEYCTKEGDYYCNGWISEQGKRTDLEDVAALVEAKASFKQIALSHPTTWIKYHKGIKDLVKAQGGFYDMKHRTTKPKVIWRWGLTGVGKTKGARDGHSTFYIKDGTQWWDGYEQQEAIIIDDFDGHWPFRDLLRLLDHEPYQGQFKGGYVPVNSPFIYITCEYAPTHFWTGNELDQVNRRIDDILEIKQTP